MTPIGVGAWSWGDRNGYAMHTDTRGPCPGLEATPTGNGAWSWDDRIGHAMHTDRQNFMHRFGGDANRRGRLVMGRLQRLCYAH